MAEEFELGLLALLAAQLGGGALIPEESLYIECPCGVKLDRVPPRRAYGVTTVIRCDGCHQNIGALEPCYHCPRGRTVAHTSGYDLCDNCAQAKAEEQTKKDEENAPKLPDPLKFVRCRCNERMEFIPVRLKYRAPCKCDGCGDAVPRLSYIYHCPKDRADEHRTAHRLFDYCFACAYKRNPTLANGSGGDSSQLQMMLSNNGTRSLSWNGNDKNLPPTNNADEKEKDKDKDKETTTDEDNAEKEAVLDDVAQLDLLKRKLQKRIIQIQQLENELQTLREANKATPATKNTGTQEAKEPEAKNQEKLPHLSILDAILQSELSRLGLPSGSSNAGNHVNEITTELVKLGIRQCAALQWLSSGDMQREKTQDNNNNNNNNNNLSVEQSNGRGIWNHVSLQSLQTMYGKLDLLFKQYDEMSNQVTSLRATCLEYISKKQDDWENWSADEVVDWISAIENGRFLKYDSHLRQVMNERHFQGKHMKTLKFDRLSALGVKDYDDADALMTCVELLVKNNHNQ